jgi:integrase
MFRRIQPLIEGHFALNDTLGKTPRSIQSVVEYVANRACISRPVSPHVLRRTFAVAAVQNGISLPAIQRLLRHDRLTEPLGGRRRPPRRAKQKVITI